LLKDDPAPLQFTSATTDTDLDGLTDIYEFQNGLDINDADTDDDGLLDGAEVNQYGTNPLSEDTDDDGVLDGIEVNQHSTNPLSEDSDNDGFLDLEEIEANTNPNDDADIPLNQSHFLLAGYSVNGAGDVNGDGTPDLIVGTPIAGLVDVRSGLDNALIYRFSASDLGTTSNGFGHSVSGIGDVNDDGYDDLVVGNPNSNEGGTRVGDITVFSGIDGSVLYQVLGDVGNGGFGQFGLRLDVAGDINQDGHQDIIVGAPSEYVYDNDTDIESLGSITIISGADGSRIHKILGEGDEGFGRAVSGIGDVNQDGNDDFAVATEYDSSMNFDSSVTLYSGDDFSVIRKYSQNNSESFGVSISNMGDLNNDMVPDLLVVDQSPTSKIEFYSGADGSVLHTVTSINSEGIGRFASSAGDVNGDGIADVIYSVANTDLVKIYSVANSRLLYDILPLEDGGTPGNPSVAPVGDIDGDGHTDLIIGYPDIRKAQVVLGNGDWDRDGLGAASDPEPLLPNN